MRPLTLVLFLLAFSLPSVQAQGTSSGGLGGSIGDDLASVIGDFLGGSSDLEQKFREAVASYKGPPCTMKPGYDGLAIRQLYDALMWIGDILCTFGITCFTKYAKDFFPIPAFLGDLVASTQWAGQVLLFGRWYHLHQPLSILLEHYKEQKDLKAISVAERPFALLIYPDLGYGEPLVSKGIRGDKDLLKDLQEGNLILHLRYPPGSFDKVDLRAIDAGEVARAVITELFPGVLVYVPGKEERRPTRTFIILGSTAPPGTPVFPTPAGCSPQAGENLTDQQRQARQQALSASYWELVGKVPYFWNDVVSFALPIVQALASFSQEMEKREKEIKMGGNAHGK